MQKRGQVTIYVIIGIIVVALLSVIIYIQKDAISSELGIGLSVPEEIREVDEYVKDCLKETGEQGLYFMGQQGGYFELPQRTAYLLGKQVPFYHFKGRDVSINQANLEESLGKFIDYQLFLCTLKFRPFYEYEIEEAEPKTKVTLTSNKMLVDTRKVLTIKKGEDEYKLKDFSVEIDTRIAKALEVAKKISLEESTEGICLSCIAELVEEEFRADVKSAGEEDFIVSILDGEEEILSFGIKPE